MSYLKLGSKIFLLLVFSLCLVGCETIHAGGSADVGGVRGSGTVVIDVPRVDEPANDN